LKNVELDEEQKMKLEEMRVNQKRCRECSKVWCNFTKAMLDRYVEETFRDFDCQNKIKIKTFLPDSTDGQLIEIECDIKPSFHVIDDDLPHEHIQQQHFQLKKNETLKPFSNQRFSDIQSKGKRVVYYMKLSNIKSSSKNFDEQQFRMTLNFQVQFRM